VLLHSELFRQRRPVSKALTGFFAFSVQEFAVMTALQWRLSLVQAYPERLFMVRKNPAAPISMPAGCADLIVSLCLLAFFQYGTGRA
jgi:hypothetical protein